MYIITQQRNKCIGCNACVEAADYRWRVSRNDGKCTLVGGLKKNNFYSVRIEDHEYDDNLLAAKNCPVNIIIITKLK
jgi:ferredoxin